MSKSFEHIQDHHGGCLPCGPGPGNHSQRHTIKGKGSLVTVDNSELDDQEEFSEIEIQLMQSYLNKDDSHSNPMPKWSKVSINKHPCSFCNIFDHMQQEYHKWKAVWAVLVDANGTPLTPNLMRSCSDHLRFIISKLGLDSNKAANLEGYWQNPKMCFL